ncbi:MAG: lipoprotein-releasing system transmembrane subunit LolC [Acidiferrobacteraceae bacterium]|nr:lipoprotein-releasing system transmembrane subunit LolC [Acidiferrobacteraceae bacterium]|tara:strand:- start:5883 stop:7130 length:1248 start_codon:yes stop_codon:yes gene_type:complete
MKYSVELLIGFRYLVAKNRDGFVSFISFISVLGIIIGVWALITVLSVMNGFEKELRERILTVASHVTITGNQRMLVNWPDIADQVKDVEGVLGIAPFINSQAMLANGNITAGALIQGITPVLEKTVSNIFDSLIEGNEQSLNRERWQIILGSDLAEKLNLKVTDKVTVITPEANIGIAGMLPRLKQFTVSGIFELGMYEYDNTLAFINIDDAANLLQTQGTVNGLRISLTDVYTAPVINADLGRILGNDFRLSDWTHEHRNFFRALQVEKRVMFLILLLIVAVAAFNVISTLVMVVVDKKSDIAILRTLGLSSQSVISIFVVQGSLIGFIGTVVGGIVGVLTAINIDAIISTIEQIVGIEFFPKSIYVISDFPSDLRWRDVSLILATSFSFSLLATLYPAWRASKTQPAEVLRYA